MPATVVRTASPISTRKRCGWSVREGFDTSTAVPAILASPGQRAGSSGGGPTVGEWSALRYDNRPVYDMLYVALAERRRTELVTADAALRAVLAGLDWVVAPQDLLR